MASDGARSRAPISISLAGTIPGGTFSSEKVIDTPSKLCLPSLNGKRSLPQKGLKMTLQTVELLDRSSIDTVLEEGKQTAQRPAASGAKESARGAQQGAVKHVPAGSGRAYWGPGERMTFLATGEETGGAFFLAEIEVAPGGGTPPHIHRREDEAFQVLEGSLTIQVGGNTITASAGDFAFLPPGIAHSRSEE